MSHYHPSSHPSQGPGSGSRPYAQNIPSSNPPPDENYYFQPRGLAEYNINNSERRHDLPETAKEISSGDGYRGHPQQFGISQGPSVNLHASNPSRPWDSSTSYGYSHEPFGLQGGPQYMDFYPNNEGVPSGAQDTLHGVMSGYHESRAGLPQIVPRDSSQGRQRSQSHLSELHSPMNMKYIPSPHRQGPYSITILNNSATTRHTIREIPVPEQELQRYIRHPTPAERASEWRHGYVKCIFKGCASPAIEPSRITIHLATHIHGRKTHECTCGARFGRMSEANRHLDDQSPCDKCHEARRKHKGTRTCSRCIGSYCNS